MPLSNAELLAKTFKDSSSNASKIVLNIKSSSAATPSKKVDNPSWMDLATELEESDKKIQENIKNVQDDPLTNPTSQHPLHHPAAPRVSYQDRSVISSTSVLHSNIDYRLCPYCSRPLWVSALQYHIEQSCPKAPPLLEQAPKTSKKRAASESNPSPTKKQKVTTDETDESSKNGTAAVGPEGTPKKRKFNMTKQRKLALAAAQAEAIARGEKPPTIDQLDLAAITKKGSKKAKKAKEKVKSSKPKAPVDVEKQCGVPLPNGGLCARSLTCKTHSMSAKRAVRGRSAPYDVLLAKYQKMNHVKLASLSTVQQLNDDNEAFGGSEINEEEEVKQVMEAVNQTKPIPMEQRVIIPVRIKSKFVKMREMLASALLPRGVRPLGGFLGRTLAVNPANAQDVHCIRSPAVSQALKQQRLMQLQRQKQVQARSLAQQQLLQQQMAQQQAAQGQQANGSGQPGQLNQQQLLLQQQQLMYQRQMLQNQQQQQQSTQPN